MLAASSFFSGCLSDRSARNSSTTNLNYPVTRKTDIVDDYHGVKVADPYRWLEDDNSPETKAWVQEQNRVTFGYFAQIPELPVIKERLTRLWNYERYGVPFKQGGRYFFTKNDGLQNQSVLYTMTSLEAPPTVLLDPNKLSADGTVALKGYAISEDGALHAEKFYRTATEEFAATRPAFRWRQLIALARVTASAHGYAAPGHDEACRLLGTTT